MRELVEAPQPLLEVEGDVPFYEPPKNPFPDQVFRKFEVGLTGLGIEVLYKVVGWHAHNPRTFWIGEIHLNPGNDWRWNAERGKFIINEMRPCCKSEFNIVRHNNKMYKVLPCTKGHVHSICCCYP